MAAQFAIPNCEISDAVANDCQLCKLKPEALNSSLFYRADRIIGYPSIDSCLHTTCRGFPEIESMTLRCEGESQRYDLAWPSPISHINGHYTTYLHDSYTNHIVSLELRRLVQRS